MLSFGRHRRLKLNKTGWANQSLIAKTQLIAAALAEQAKIYNKKSQLRLALLTLDEQAL